MTKRNGLKTILAATLCGSLLLPSSVALSQMSPLGGGFGGGIGDVAGGLFGSGGKATRVEQFAQIALQEQELEKIVQALESLSLDSELAQVFEQMLGIQTVVEDVVAYEVPPYLVQEYELINPLEHKQLAEERTEYMKEIDAEIAALEADIVMSPDQFDTLATALNSIEQPRSEIIATQAQFIGDQAALEQERRKMAIDILRNKREDIKRQLEVANSDSLKAALKCVNSPVDVKC